jgi:hypothetical protein
VEPVDKNLGRFFSDAFYVMTKLLLVSLLYDTLNMVKRVTETCRCDE